MKKRKLQVYIVYIVASILSFIVLFPILWMVITSLKTTPEIYAFPMVYFPKQVTLEHYHSALSEGNFLMYLKNSIIISSSSVILSLIVSILPAYALARFKFPGKSFILATVLLLVLLPQVSFVVPMFQFLRTVRLVNSYIGVVISYLPFVTPIQIMLLLGFFAEIPKSIEEAAVIDGSSYMTTFMKIVLPISMPSIVSVGIYSFFFSWNELMFSMSFLTQQNKQTIPVFLSFLVGEFGINWGQLFAAATLATLPALVIFVFLQRFFMAGLVAGAVKD